MNLLSVISVVLATSIALSAGQARVCPVIVTEPYYLHANGFIALGYRSRLNKAVAQTGNIEIQNGVQIETAWSGTGIVVGWNVDILSGFLFVEDASDVIFECNDLPPPAQVCELRAPPACDADEVLVFPCAELENPVMYDTSAAADVTVYPAIDDNPNKEELFVYGKQRQEITLDIVPVVFTGVKRDWRDLNVKANGIVAFNDPGVYRFRRVDLEADVTFWFGGSNNDYFIYVEEWFDADERFVMCNNGNQVTIYQNADFGHVFIGNAPSNRDHELQVNIISRGTYNMGGFVCLGYRQYIRGYIAAQGDILVLPDTIQVGPNDPPRFQREQVAEVKREAPAAQMRKRFFNRGENGYPWLGGKRILKIPSICGNKKHVCDHDVDRCTLIGDVVNHQLQQRVINGRGNVELFIAQNGKKNVVLSRHGKNRSPRSLYNQMKVDMAYEP